MVLLIMSSKLVLSRESLLIIVGTSDNTTVPLNTQMNRSNMAV
jgi:hypothetical protein